jgi:hypothetical protein
MGHVNRVKFWANDLLIVDYYIVIGFFADDYELVALLKRAKGVV